MQSSQDELNGRTIHGYEKTATQITNMENEKEGWVVKTFLSL